MLLDTYTSGQRQMGECLQSIMSYYSNITWAQNNLPPSVLPTCPSSSTQTQSGLIITQGKGGGVQLFTDQISWINSAGHWDNGYHKHIAQIS